MSYITYCKETDSYVVNCKLDPIDAIKLLDKFGFVDASILHDDVPRTFTISYGLSCAPTEPTWASNVPPPMTTVVGSPSFAAV